MSEQQEDAFVPKIRSPRLLLDLAAEAFSLILLSVSMPIIRTLSYERQEVAAAMPMKSVRRANVEMLRKHPWVVKLCRLKSWYWMDMNKHFGTHGSRIRCAVSHWLLELTYLHRRFRNYEPLHRYAMQLLFSSDVGNLKGMTHATIRKEICHQFSIFIHSMAPFYTRGLYDNSIKFKDPRPVSLVMHNSALRWIHLSHNLSKSTLDELRHSCRNAEIITFDMAKLDEENHSILESSGQFFKTFFANQGSARVLQAVHDRAAVPQSFTFLKEVCFRFDHVLVGFSLFVQTLNCVYPGVRIKLSCLASVPYGHYKVKYPFVCPTYHISTISHSDMVAQVFFCNDDIPIDKWVKLSPENIVDADKLCHTLRIFVSSAFFMQDVMAMLQVRNLRYIFSDKLKLHTTPNVSSRAPNISELFVFGPISNETTDKELVDSLNQCPNLDVLGFMIKPMTTPVLQGLKPLTNLKVLSVRFTALRPCGAVVDTRYAHCQGGPLTEKEADRFTQLLIMAAPNLEILEVTCIDNLQKLISDGHLQKLRTFSIVAGNKKNIKGCIMSLPCLEVVLFEQFIDYNTYLDLKRCFYYSQLHIAYKKGRLVPPFIDGP